MNAPLLRGLALAAPLLLAPPQDPAPPAPADAAAADAKLLVELMERARPLVEKARGRKFEKLPVAEPTTREAFLEKHHRDLELVMGGKDRVAASSRLLERLGIIPAGSDLRALLREYLPQTVAAQYDPAAKRITFLPGASRDLGTMIHEMIHALDDAHFDMMKRVNDFAGEFDRALAYGSLCEGDATSAEKRITFGEAFGKQPLEALRTQGNYLADMLLKQGGRTPPALALAFKSQYIDGMVFAEALRRKGGEEAVDAAFRKPPASTEQVLHPEKYLADEAPVVVRFPAPEGEGRVAVETPLGELGVFLVLVARGATTDAARTAAAGWGGDRVALVSHGTQGEALVWTTAWDTEADALEFEAALKAAFPREAAEGKPVRGILAHGTTVDFVEAPLDLLEGAVKMARGAKREAPPAPATPEPAAPSPAPEPAAPPR